MFLGRRRRRRGRRVGRRRRGGLGRFGGRGYGCRCGCGPELPRAVDHACILGSEEIKKTFGEVKTTVRATGALVDDLSLGCLAIRSDGYHVETMTTASVLSRVERNDVVTRSVCLTTCTKPVLVECEPRVLKPFAQIMLGTQALACVEIPDIMRTCCDKGQRRGKGEH